MPLASRATRSVSSAAVRVVSTACTCCVAPRATSPTASAISATARPASSEVAAICWDAELTDAADTDTCPIIELRLVRVSS